MEIIERQAARAGGLVRYFTGRPCARGHVAERLVRSTDCVVCNRENGQRKRRNNLEHYRAKGRQSSRRKYAKNAPRRASRRIAKQLEARAKAEERKPVVLEKMKRWREANPNYMREWKAANRDKVRGYRRGRRIHRRRRVVDQLMVAQRGKCAYCRTRLDPEKCHVDHIQPRALGGSNRRRNLQLACAGCNGRKGAKPPEQYAREVGLLI